MRCLNLLVGVARLCLACVQLHKGVMGNVSWMFTDTAYRESLRRAIVREVREGEGGGEGRLFTRYLF